MLINIRKLLISKGTNLLKGMVQKLLCFFHTPREPGGNRGQQKFIVLSRRHCNPLVVIFLSLPGGGNPVTR